jgi:hypothetical protein
MGISPTKLDSRHTLLVRNISSKATGFRLRTGPPFAVSPSEVYLEEGSTVQVRALCLLVLCGSVCVPVCVCPPVLIQQHSQHA